MTFSFMTIFCIIKLVYPNQKNLTNKTVKWFERVRAGVTLINCADWIKWIQQMLVIMGLLSTKSVESSATKVGFIEILSQKSISKYIVKLRLEMIKNFMHLVRLLK